MDRSFLEENGVDVNAGLELLGDMDNGWFFRRNKWKITKTYWI